VAVRGRAARSRGWAIASAAWVDSPVALSESPAFKRKFPSVYDALDEGQLDRDRLAQVLSGWKVEGAQTIADYEIYGPSKGHFACDSTANGPSKGHLPRPEADCLPDRVFLKSDKDTPAVSGQEYAGIVRVLREKSSWVAPFDLQRVSSTSTASAVAAQQVKCLHDLTPQPPPRRGACAKGHYCRQSLRQKWPFEGPSCVFGGFCWYPDTMCARQAKAHGPSKGHLYGVVWATTRTKEASAWRTTQARS